MSEAYIARLLEIQNRILKQQADAIDAIARALIEMNARKKASKKRAKGAGKGEEDD